MRTIDARYTGRRPHTLEATRPAKPAPAEIMRGSPVRAATATYDTSRSCASTLFTLTKAVFMTLHMATVTRRA